MALISCKNASFDYDGNTVVSGLNFEVDTGDYLCVVGENGSGKSTLVKGLLHLKNPQSGEIIYGEGLKSTEIGYLPQQTAAQKDFPASAYEVVISGLLGSKGFSPFYSKADKAAAKSNMELLKVTDLAKKCYRELSGGQQQRVLLARALCATEKLLLLDEPVAGLDPIATNDLYAAVEQINKQGVTVIMVSHDVKTAVEYANKILHLNNEQAYFGDTAGYVESEVGRVFLGTAPQVNTATGGAGNV